MWKVLLATCFAAAAAVAIEINYPEEANYNLPYIVNDPLAGDFKNQWAKRIGNKILGPYRLIEPDGTIRIADYYAGCKNGFRATFSRQGQVYHQIAVPLQPHQNVISSELLKFAYIPRKRNYYGAIFVKEKDYGRGLGYF